MTTTTTMIITLMIRLTGSLISLPIPAAAAAAAAETAAAVVAVAMAVVVGFCRQVYIYLGDQSCDLPSNAAPNLPLLLLFI